MILSPHEGKASTHFHEEFFNMIDQTDFYITLVILLCESKHIKNVWVLEH